MPDDENLQMFRDLLKSVFQFSEDERFKKRYEKSIRLFTDIPPERSIDSISWTERDKYNFLTWFCFEVKEKGTSISDIWAEENRLLAKEGENILKALNSSTMALYELTTDVKSPEELLLKDIFNKKIVTIKEPVIYQLRDKPLLFGLRIVQWSDLKLSAGDFYVYPREITDDIADFFHRHLQGFYGEEIDRPTSFPRGAGYLFNHLRLALKRSDDMMRKRNKEKEDWSHGKLEKIISHFKVEDYEKTIEKLQELQNVTFLGEEAGYRFYEWYHDDAMAGKDDPDAGIVLTKRKLVIHCPKVKCVEMIKSVLDKALAGVAEHVYDTVVKRRE